MESARLSRRLLPDIVRLRASVEGYRTAFSFIHDTGEIESIDARSLYLRACAIAAHLHRSHLTGRRGLLLYAPGLEFICAFVGAMLAGVVAVPVMPPTVHRRLKSFQAIALDAEADVVLTTGSVKHALSRHLHEWRALHELPWLATDRLPLDDAAQWPEPSIDGDDLAYKRAGTRRARLGRPPHAPTALRRGANAYR